MRFLRRAEGHGQIIRRYRLLTAAAQQSLDESGGSVVLIIKRGGNALFEITPPRQLRRSGCDVYMNGFLSDGVRDLISVVSFLLAIGAASVSAFKLLQKFRKGESYRANLRDEDSRSLFNVVWQFIKSPKSKDAFDSEEARHDFYFGLSALAVASLLSLLFSFKQEWGALIMLSIVASIFEIVAFASAFSTVDDWLGKTEATQRHQLGWRMVAFGCWLSSILLFPLLAIVRPLVQTRVGIVLAMHTMSLIVITFFVVIAWVGLYIKEKLFD